MVWIGLRDERDNPIICVDEVMASQEQGLVGDRYCAKSGKRQVTIVQYEHLAVIESIIGKPIDPASLRRNLVVRGINLLALKQGRFHIGPALFESTGLCHPCSKMERALGPGGFNAMRGHGGLTARVVEDGMIRLGDAIVPQQADLFSD